MFGMAWYEILRKARDNEGFTRGQLAVKIGVSSRSIQNWEEGGIKPLPENRSKLHKALNIKPNHIDYLDTI